MKGSFLFKYYDVGVKTLFGPQLMPLIASLQASLNGFWTFDLNII
jgi:hypothetical protein